jgi:hypothetical protein
VRELQEQLILVVVEVVQVDLIMVELVELEVQE